MTGDKKRRNRAEGWKYAKLSGHENEKEVTVEVMENIDLQNRILKVAHRKKQKIVSIDYGGLNEKDVPCALGGFTKSKSDMVINLDNGETIGISIKKSLGGQVYLIGAERFINGFEKQFNKKISANVKEAIYLYWGNSAKTLDIINKYSKDNKSYEIRKHRVVADTLKKYSQDAYDCLLDWFNANIQSIFEFCFSRGLAKDSKDWATLIWYKNDIRELDIDVLINIKDAEKCISNKTYYGTRTGGSTIQLPFGFVQWHSPQKTIPGDMQFHHKYKKIVDMIRDYCEFYNIVFDENNPTNGIEGDDE